MFIIIAQPTVMNEEKQVTGGYTARPSIVQELVTATVYNIIHVSFVGFSFLATMVMLHIHRKIMIVTLIMGIQYYII